MDVLWHLAVEQAECDFDLLFGAFVRYTRHGGNGTLALERANGRKRTFAASCKRCSSLASL